MCAAKPKTAVPPIRRVIRCVILALVACALLWRGTHADDDTCLPPLGGDAPSPWPVVDSVGPGSPAARAGIGPGDTLISVAGRDLRGPLQGPPLVDSATPVRIVWAGHEGHRSAVVTPRGTPPRLGVTLVGTFVDSCTVQVRDLDAGFEVGGSEWGGLTVFGIRAAALGRASLSFGPANVTIIDGKGLQHARLTVDEAMGVAYGDDESSSGDDADEDATRRRFEQRVLTVVRIRPGEEHHGQVFVSGTGLPGPVTVEFHVIGRTYRARFGSATAGP